MLQSPWNEKRIRPSLWLLDLQVSTHGSYNILSQNLRFIRLLLRTTQGNALSSNLGLLHIFDQDTTWLSAFPNFNNNYQLSRANDVHLITTSCNISRMCIVPNYHNKCLISGRSSGVRFGFASMPLLANAKTPYSSMPGQIRW